MNEDGLYSQPMMCIMEWLSTFRLFLEPAFLALWLFWDVTLEAAKPNVILTPWLQSWARMESLSQCFHPQEFVTGTNKSQAFPATLQPIFPQLPQVLCSAKWTRCRVIYQKREQNVDLTKGQVTDGQRSCI